MSIEKYLKPSPDYTIANSAWASTDNQNLRLYKLSNAGDDNIGLEWAYATNYNNTDFNNNTYTNVYSVYGGDKGYKTGIKTQSLLPLANGRKMLQINDDNAKWNKINGGLAYGILYFNGDPVNANYTNMYVCENLDYSRVVLQTSGHDSSADVPRKMSDNDNDPITDGMGIYVTCYNPNTNSFEQMGGFNLAYGTISDDNIATIRLNSAYRSCYYEAQVGVKNTATQTDDIYINFEWELPFRSDPSAGYKYIFGLTHKNQLRELFTVPHTKQALLQNVFVYRTYHAGVYCSTTDVLHWKMFMNSTGLRYYDSGEFTTTSDIKSNVYMGVMDNNGITDSTNRIKGWDTINSSDLPNAHRNGYEWDVYDPTRPIPDSDKDDTEKMTFGGFYAVGGLVKYYSLVNTPEHKPLEEISENLSNWDYVETGKDVIRNLISLKAFPLSRENLCRGTTKNVIIAGTDTGVTGQTIDSIYDRIVLGSIDIPHRYNDFRDYAPFTKIEICVPFVGWIPLPSHAMGHNIKVEMTYDIVSGSCKVYVILDDNTIIAEACGNIAMDIPFSADAVGVKAAQLITGGLGIASSALSLGTGLISGNTVGSASGIIGLANSITQTVCSNNANYTEVRGNTGDANNFYGVKQCYLKITYPISHLPDNYGKSVGHLYNKNAVLSRGMGFTKTSNTYIHGSMLESEKAEIIALMENGVIL